VARFDHGYSPGFERAFNSARSTSGWVEALILVVLSATTLICAGRGGKQSSSSASDQLGDYGYLRQAGRRWPERGRRDATRRDADAAVDDSNA
jgi:hypothetical protein